MAVRTRSAVNIAVQVAQIRAKDPALAGALTTLEDGIHALENANTAASAATPPATGTTASGDVTLGTPQLSYEPPDQQGKIKAKITVPFTPPAPLGTWDHVKAYLIAPDDSVSTSKAIIQDPAGGNVGFFVGPAGTGSNIVPNFVPIPFGPFHASENMLVVEHPSPAVSETWRIYAVSGSQLRENTLIPHGAAGESPSVAVTVAPATTAVIGAANAPNASGLTGTFQTRTNENGQAVWSFKLTWTNPTSDPRYPQLGGYDVTVEGQDGITINPLASPSRSDTSYQSPWWPFASTAPYIYVIRLVSWDVNARKNAIIPGVTPSVSLVIQRPAGGAGEEYTTLAAFVHAVIEYTTDVDGSEKYRFNLMWVPPADSTYGGLAPVAVFADGHSVKLGVSGPADASLVTVWYSIHGTDAASVHFISFDRSNRDNTYKTGVTPEVVGLVITPQTTGKLKGGRIDPLTLAANLAANAGLLGIAPHSITDTQVTPGGISTPSLTTLEIAIGGGGSKPVRVRGYNSSGSAFFWFGDDSAVSGFQGGWFQEFRAGGSGPAGAPFVVDSLGKLTIDLNSVNAGGTAFKLALNSVTTTIANGLVAGQTAGVSVLGTAGAGSLYETIMAPGLFAGIYSGALGALLGVSDSGGTKYGNLVLYWGASVGVQLAPYTLVMNGQQVVTIRQTGPGTASGWSDATAQAWANNLLVALRAHGLIT